jgi:hypothetical protein
MLDADAGQLEFIADAEMLEDLRQVAEQGAAPGRPPRPAPTSANSRARWDQLSRAQLLLRLEHVAAALKDKSKQLQRAHARPEVVTKQKSLLVAAATAEQAAAEAEQPDLVRNLLGAIAKGAASSGTLALQLCSTHFSNCGAAARTAAAPAVLQEFFALMSCRRSGNGALELLRSQLLCVPNSSTRRSRIKLAGGGASLEVSKPAVLEWADRYAGAGMLSCLLADALPVACAGA